MPSSLGPAEILVILVVALIVLGPKRLPEAGRQVGKALAEIRHWSSTVQNEISDALDVTEEPQPPPAAAAPPAPSTPSALEGPAPPPPSPAPEWNLPPVEAPPPPAAPRPSSQALPPEWTAPPRSPDT